MEIKIVIDDSILKKTKSILISKKTIALIAIFTIIFSTAVFGISSLTKPHTFNEGDVIYASEINENFDALYDKVNEIIGSMNSLPAGTIVPFGGDIDKVPEGWLLCDGTSYNQGDYADLFNIISTNFGSDSASTFNVPDLRGMFLRGSDNTAGYDPDASSRIALKTGGNTGDVVGSYQDDVVQDHTHSYKYYLHGTMITNNDSETWAMAASKTTANTGNITNGRASSETRPKNVNVNYIIKY